MTPSTSTENAVPEAQVRLPFNAYKVRCLTCERKQAKSGQPMLVLECEITDSQTFQQDGQTINPNGITITGWISLQTKMIDQINSSRKSFGLSPVKTSEIDSINPDDYVGQVAPVIAVSKPDELKNDVTGEKILNPITQKPVIQWNKRINQWLPRE